MAANGEEGTARYMLSRELRGHSRDVRCACFVPPHSVATGSHDTTVCVWDLRAEAGAAPVRTLLGHTKGVGALAYYEHAGRGRLLSGGYDSAVFVWDAAGAGGEPLLALLGHTGAVVCAAVDGAGARAVTASWDGTARVWDLAAGCCVAVLAGHTSAVWACAWLPGSSSGGGSGGAERVVTGSADRTVRVWDAAGAALRTCAPVHSDCVRGIAVLARGAFATASNDGTLALWAADGTPSARGEGHTSFVYDVRVLLSDASGDNSDSDSGATSLVSCGEDRTARVWTCTGSGMECVQCVQHPGTVWQCAALAGGAFVSCCADGVARVWTRDAAAAAPAAVRAAYAASCRSAVAAGAVGDGACDAAAMATTAGRYDGDVRVFSDGTPRAYRWDAAAQRWDLIGDVVSGPPGSDSSDSGNVFEGRRYDHVFDVELDGRHMRLPYNNGDNPYLAAQEFIDREALQQDMLDDIAKHIIAHTPAGAADAVRTDACCDPLTGGSRYIPGAEHVAQPEVSLDKVPGYTVRDTSDSGSSSSSSSSKKTRRQCENIPQREPRTFPIANVGAVLGKLRTAEDGGSDTDAAGLLTRAEVAALAAVAAGTLPSAATVRRLAAYPADALLPVLGYFSVVALQPGGAALLVDAGGVLACVAAAVAAAPALHVVAMRLLTNIAATCAGCAALLAPAARAQQTAAVCTACAAPGASDACHAALCRLLFNVAVFADTAAGAAFADDALLALFVRLLERETPDPMVTANLVLALGTLLWNCSALAPRARALGAVAAVSRSISSSSPALRDTAIDVSLFLQDA